MTDKEIRELIEKSNDLTCSINNKGRFTWLSNSSESFLGYSFSKVMGKSIVDFVPKEDVKANLDFFQNLRSDKKSQTLNNRLISKEGTVVQVQWLIHRESEFNDALCHVNIIAQEKPAIIGGEEDSQSYRNLFHHNPLPNIICAFNTFQILEVNQAVLDNFGYNREELQRLTVSDFLNTIEKHQLVEAQKKLESNDKIVDIGICYQKNREGMPVKMQLSGYQFHYKQQQCIMLICNDIAEDQLIKELDALERKIMEASIQMDFNLKGLLYSYARGLEDIFNGMRVSILKIHSGKLQNLASPSLPKSYIEAINGERIGETVGSCGSAAFRKKRVIVSDIDNDPLWKDYKTLAFENGLKSCWSEPIFNHKKEVVATFANYYAVTKVPSQKELDFFNRSATLLSLILENHQKGEALISSNERYTYVNRATDDAIYDWDVENDIFHWGGGFQRIFLHNYKDKVFRLQDWVDLMHPADHERTDESWDAFIASKSQAKWNREFRFKRGNGTYAYVEEIGHLIRDNEGKPKRMIGVLRDRSEQKKEEHRLKLMERVVTNANDAIIITEAQPIIEPGPRIVYVNEAFTKMTGYLPAEVIGKTPRILQGPDSDRAALRELSSALKKMQPYEITTINYNKNKEKYWVNFSVVPVANEQSTFTHYIAIQRDVTAQKRKELQRNLLNEISQLFNQQVNLKLTLEKVLKHLVQFGNIFLAEAWLLDEDKKKLILMAKYANGNDAELFYKESSEINTFDCGQGLPGRVWELQKSIIWDDLDKKDLFLRNKAAKKAGLKSGLGIPIFHNEAIVGVMVFCSRHSEKSLSSYEFLFKELETQLGVEIKRKMLEDELFQFFHNAPDILCVAGPDGIFKRVNPAFCKLMGYSEEELTSRHFTEFILSEDLAQTNTEYTETINGLREADSFINRYVTKDGDHRWISWNSSKIYGSEGLAFAYGRDITDKKKLENLLDTANSLARIGGWELDLENQSLYFSKITREIHEVDENYKPQLEAGINFYREDVKDYVRNIVKEAVEQNREWDFEQPIITAKGNERWVRSIGKPEFREGKCVKIIGSFQDITQRKRSEELIRQSNERFEKVTEATNDAIWDWDIENNSVYVSAGFYKLFGFESGKIINSDQFWSERAHKEDSSEVMRSLKKVIADKTSNHWLREYRVLHANESVKNVMDRGIVIRNSKGKAIRMVGAIADITHRKKYEESLKELNETLDKRAKELAVSNAELEQFAFVASHDLQEPLRMVTSFLMQLENKYGDKLDEKAHKYIYFAVDGAKRMRQIILDLLEFSRAGKNTEKSGKVAVKELINEAQLLQRRTIAQSSAKIVVANLPDIQLHKAPFLQVFQNLIGNALKYSKDDIIPEITISAKSTRDFYVFAVKDNGIGIEEKYFDKIFIIFQRLHAKDKYKGSGMGLSIVKKIIENNGGQIWLESELGKGTTFYFSVPKK